MERRTVANTPILAAYGLGFPIATLTDVEVDAVTCRARPVPCAADVGGTGGVTVVTGDQRMISILLAALTGSRKVDIEYGEPLEYYESHFPPATYSGYLLQRITLK